MQSPQRGPRRDGAARGFTLVEVMVATVLLSMIILGILSVLIGSYRVAAKARYNDQARYVIKSLSDQFLTQQSSDSSGNVYPMFQPTVDTNPGPNLGNQTPLGTGISWTSTDPTITGLGPTSGNYGYVVELGGETGKPITATVTRSVWNLYDSTGQETLLNQTKSAGSMIEGTFTITYPLFGGTATQSITSVRAMP